MKKSEAIYVDIPVPHVPFHTKYPSHDQTAMAVSL